MPPQTAMKEQPPDLSLVLGGPCYNLYLRTKLAGPALQLLVRRVLITSLVCWIPPFLLAALGGSLTGGVTVPFLRDPDVHIRFLLALPLLIGSECYVHQRMRRIAPQFLSRGIIAADNQAGFEEIVASNKRLRNSVVAEVILLVLVLTLGFWFWRRNVSLNVSTWYAVDQGNAMRLTPAGWYYAFVSLSIFRFLLYRWYFRLFIWYRFLWQVRALPLHLNLYHPDRACGLGFLSGSVMALAPVFVAQTVLLAGVILTRILYQQAALTSFKMEIIGILVFCVLMLVIPLGFFFRRLEHAERTAKGEFGTLASRYVDDFHRKWIESGGRGEPLLGTADIQSLADLSKSFEVANRIRLFVISKETLTRLVAMLALPFLPLLLTMFPLDEALHRLFKLVF